MATLALKGFRVPSAADTALLLELAVPSRGAPPPHPRLGAPKPVPLRPLRQMMLYQDDGIDS